MERIKKEELNPVAKLHIIYGSIIMFLCIAFSVTLLTMKGMYKSDNINENSPPPMVQGDAKNMQTPSNMGSGASGAGGGMPPFIKQMVQKYKDALAKNPKDTEALTGLANMYYDSGQYPKAIEHYKKVIEIDEKNSNVQSDLGTAYFYTKDLKNAEVHLKKALEFDEKNLNARYNLGVVYKELGKKDEAKKSWEAMKPYLANEEQKKKIEAEINSLK
ncbi:MAG: tetratricopeptide repeat protein [Candidatus Sericytochromatia bacterium]